jgi:biopolymer transport protein ExbD
MKFSNRQPPAIAIQLAPMIDILLLLLCFFIISWQFSKSET